MIPEPIRRKPTIAFLLVLLLGLGVTISCNLTQPAPPATPVYASPAATNFGPAPTATALPASPLPPPASPTPTLFFTPAPLPAALLETSPLQGAELALDSTITFYFNQPMNRRSVEAAISGEPLLSGRFSWLDDAAVTFIPDAPFPPALDQQILIAASALSANGQPLAAPLRLHYRTAGALELSETLPAAGSSDVNPTSAVMAVFNRPAALPGLPAAGLPPAFTLDPPAPGYGEWLNASVYIFYPQPGLLGGQTYLASLDPALAGAGGSSEWSFTVASPALARIHPAAGDGLVGLDEPVVLQFNQSMQRDSVEAAFSLNDASGAAQPGSFAWDDASTTLTFMPAAQYQRETVYRLNVGGSAASIGGAALGSAVQSTFTTVPVLRWMGSSPAEGGETAPDAPLALYFNAPLPDSGLEAFLSFSPPVGNLSVASAGEPGVLLVDADFYPETQYSLNVSPELPDRWGAALGDSVTLRFRTASLDPALRLVSPGDVYFLTGADVSLPAEGANLTSVLTARAAVALPDFLRMISPDGLASRRDYYPAGADYWKQTIALPSNALRSASLFLNPDSRPLLPGLYHYRLEADELAAPPGPLLLVISDVNLTFKTSASDVLVWAYDLKTNAPAAGASLAIYNLAGQEAARGVTDSDGVFRATLPSDFSPQPALVAVLGEPGDAFFSLALSSWSQGLNDWTLGQPASGDAAGQFTYLYTDQPIYRPGQTVFFRAIPRLADNGRYREMQLASLDAAIYDAAGARLAAYSLPLTGFGSAAGAFTLPPDARPGVYRLEAGSEDSASALTFQVVEYRKPAVGLSLRFLPPAGATDSASPADTLAGETLRAEINARYFFDAPAANLRVEWTLTRAPADFALPGFMTGADQTSWLQGKALSEETALPLAQGELLTGPDGIAILEIPTSPEIAFHRYTLEVSLQDEVGLPVSARAVIAVHPARFYIGLHADTVAPQAGASVGFDVRSVDWSAQAAGGRSLRAELARVNWRRAETGDADVIGAWVAVFETVATTDFVTAPDGGARLAFTPPEPGVYALRIAGEGASSEITLWAYGDAAADWPPLPNNHLPLVLANPPVENEGRFNAGETVKIFIANPFGQPAAALVTVERSRVMRYLTMPLAAGGGTLDLLLTDEDAPNVFVSVTLLGRASDGAADFRHGSLPLEIVPQQQTLSVALSAQPQDAAPGDEITLALRITDAGGQPVQAEFSLALFDSAAPAGPADSPAGIVDAFYGGQGWGVRTALSLAAHARRAGAAAQVTNDAAAKSGRTLTAANFPATVYWDAALTTDANGEAQVTLILPENAATLRLDVRALADETRVGQALLDFRPAGALSIQPITPRFLHVGDRVRLAATVQNNTGANLPADVILEASGFVLDDPADVSASPIIPAGGQALVTWWGVAQDAPEASLTFRVTGRSGDQVYEDVAQPPRGALPIVRYTQTQAITGDGMLAAADAAEARQLLAFSLPATYLPQSGGLQASLAPSLAASMLGALDALEQPAFESTDALLARFFPQLEVYRALESRGGDPGLLAQQLESRVADGLALLLARQRPDGGWGWWPGADWEASDPVITATVVFGLSRARAAGFVVEETALQNAGNFLRNQIASGEGAAETWQLNRLALMHFALAEVGRGDLTAVQSLADTRSQLDPWAQALLALTLETLEPGSVLAAALLDDMQAAATLDSRGAAWLAADARNGVSSVTGSAMAVYALAQRDPASPLLPEATRSLLAQRRAGGGWATPFETTWVLLALAQATRGAGDLPAEYEFGARVNGIPAASGLGTASSPVSFWTPFSQWRTGGPNALELWLEGAPGRLFYNAHLIFSRPVEDVQPLNHGMTLARRYTLPGDACPLAACESLRAAPAGQALTVRLTLSLPQAVYGLALEDYIPAGSEILDTSLKTRQQLDPASGNPLGWYDARDPAAQGWGWWWFHTPTAGIDRITFTADYLPAGTYELTYTLILLYPGEYRSAPARAWLYAFPEVEGATAGEIFVITTEE